MVQVVPFPLKNFHFANIVVIEPTEFYLDTLEFDHDKIVEAFEGGRDKARSVVRALDGVAEPADKGNAESVVLAALEELASRPVAG